MKLCLPPCFSVELTFVKADPQDRYVTISVEGPVASRRRLLAVIRSDFDRIHSSFKFKPKELVPVPGHPTVTVSYKELLAREKQNRTSFEVFLGDDTLLELNVKDLLNGVDLEGSRQRQTAGMERRTDALRLFYSYSHKDEILRDQLDTHLKILERQGLIQSWHDRRILGGEDWAQEIDTNLQQADIVLLLISADFIASDYCYNIEMEQAMERHQAGKAKVIPVLVRAADFSGTPFKDLQGFPTDMKAVTQWSDRDSAWLNVETGIKNAIDAIKAKRA
ncbi:MAG: toll/interleukin-1 receptor domain-containing protein [Cyanobacteria bacterium J06634_5]